jgi:hypothetical protein
MQTVLHMDVLEFNAVHGILFRLTYKEKEENAWVSMVAAQGRQGDMRGIVREWRSAVGDDAPAATQKAAQGASDFLRALKINPKGGRF